MIRAVAIGLKLTRLERGELQASSQHLMSDGVVMGTQERKPTVELNDEYWCRLIFGASLDEASLIACLRLPAPIRMGAEPQRPKLLPKPPDLLQ